MIRLIQRRLIIPRGDTGSFSIPALSKSGADNIAVFTIFDETTKTRMFQKTISGEGDVLTIAFTHSDTVNLKPGKYVWDIKYYSNPEFIDDELVNGEEVNSYYAGFSLPVCEIRETADNYLVSPEAPTATLSPEQLEIVTGAIHSLNEAIRKTQENVEHYPEIRDEVWYAWDAELGDYVNTGVRANGIVGNGIASAVLNDDYTLTLNFTDGTSFTSTSIRGQRGNGIEDIVLNNDFTLTITYTDGDSYITPSIRGPVGATPQFSIGTVQDGAVAAVSITGTAENPVLNLTLPNAHVPTRVSQLENDAGYLTEHQDLSDYVKNTDYATNSKAGIIKVGNGLYSQGNAIHINAAPERIVKMGASDAAPIVASNQHASTFYGLAKAAGDTTQSQSSNAVGTYTNEAKSAIQQMLDVPSNEEMNTAITDAIGQINSFDMAVVQTLPTQDISTHTIYLVPKTGETNDVYDEYIYINNAWEMVGNTQIDLSNYVQKTDYATANNAGVVKIGGGIGIGIDGSIAVIPATKQNIKDGQAQKYISSNRVHTSTFYGLAKAAGDTTQSQSDNAVGTYTNEAKTAIQTMLDVPAKDDIPEVPVQDVQVNGVSVLSDGVANVPIATTANRLWGVAKVGDGLYADNSGWHINRALDKGIKEGKGTYLPLTPSNQQVSTFYGLAKAAGSDEKNSTLPVGQYTDNAKEAIQSMLGITQMLAPTNPNLVATQAYSIGDVFAANGHLYKATAAIAQDEAIIPDTNCVETTMVDAGGKIKDVQVAGSSIVGNDGVANIPIGANAIGVVNVSTNTAYGLQINSTSGFLQLAPASENEIKTGDYSSKPIGTSRQHIAAFYGLSKVAGVDLANETVTLGTYPETSKTAIKEMLGVQDGLKVVRLI